MPKRGNEYMSACGPGFYTDTPKAVWAALAVALAVRLGGITEEGEDAPADEFAAAAALIREEWRALHAIGIVPQAPPKGDAHAKA